MRRPRFAPKMLGAFALFAAAAGVACVKGPTEGSLGILDPTDTAIAGSYNLVAINGLPLPSTTQINSAQAIQVEGERIIIGADRAWVDTSTTVIIDLASGTGSAPTLTASAGSLNITNGTINFVTTSGGGSAFTGSVKKDTLTVLFTRTRFIYVK